MNYYIDVIKKYATFEGRARRKEYWTFALVGFLISLVLGFFDRIIFDTGGYGILTGLYSLFIFLPSLAVAVRRLHDIGKSGWMILVGLIPFIGWIWLLVLYLTDSEPGPNEYGPNPKETEQAAV